MTTTPEQDHGVIEAINRAITLHPELTAFGFGAYEQYVLDGFSPEDRKAAFQCSRAAMFEPMSLEDFRRAYGWLNRQKRTLHVNEKVGTSYGLKHLAEKEIGYVSNGIFIAAALACGFKIKRDIDRGHPSPNAFLNISSLVRRPRKARTRDER